LEPLGEASGEAILKRHYTIHDDYALTTTTTNIQCEIKGCCARMWNWVRSVPCHWRYWHKKKKISREIWPLG